MTFRATNVIPERGYGTAKVLAVNARDYAARESVRLQGTVNSDRILAIYHDMRRAKDELESIQTIPGIAAYAQDQEIDPTYDVVTEFVALIAAIQNVMGNIETTFPADGNGYLLEKKFNAQGTYDFRQFTPAMTATLKGFLDAVVASVS